MKRPTATLRQQQTVAAKLDAAGSPALLAELAEMRQLAEVIVPPCHSRCAATPMMITYSPARWLLRPISSSGDADLLDLREYQSIPIVDASEALRLIARA